MTPPAEAPETTRPTRFAAPSLLTDLLASGLDAGYAEAAQRRRNRPQHAGHGADRAFEVLAVVVAVLAGLVVALGWNEAHRGEPAQEAVRQQLVTRARAAGADADALERQVTAAAARVAALQGTALSGDQAGRDARAALSAAQVAAGAVPVSGPGLRVELGDPSAPETDPAGGRAGSTPIGEVRVVSDIDVRDLVNVLWGAGAEAVAVNQVRITPVSAIRFAGADILVDLRTVTSPYTIEAVGAGDRLSVAFAQSEVAARFATYAANRGVSFSFDTVGSLSLPAGVVADPEYASTPPASTTPPAGTTPPTRTTPPASTPPTGKSS
ncbi:DUF881 domain-containing protein [Jatrophihabitans sp. YIM 134969]